MNSNSSIWGTFFLFFFFWIPGHFQREAPNLDLWHSRIPVKHRQKLHPDSELIPFSGAPQLLPHCFNCLFFTSVWAEWWHRKMSHDTLCRLQLLCACEFPLPLKLTFLFHFCWQKCSNFFYRASEEMKRRKKYCLTMRPKVWKSYRDRYFCLFQKIYSARLSC